MCIHVLLLPLLLLHIYVGKLNNIKKKYANNVK